MTRDPTQRLEPMYPDVLGAITGGTRISMDKLQCALGVFPRRTYINQPVEIILILQNMVDQNMQLKVGIQLPTQDRKGGPVVMDTPKKMVTLGLRPGEVGVLRMPVIPLPPTQPGTGFPVRVAVRYRTPAEGRSVRPPTGGAPPTVLSISAFKLQALREVEFSAHTWNKSAEIMTTYFDIAPKRVPLSQQNLQARYESLWTHEEMEEERELVRARIPDAIRISAGLTRSAVLRPITHAVEERFADRGIPLHPGEALAIAKMITYTLDEGLELEPGFDVQESRWFQTLCQVLAHDPDLELADRGELAVHYLFEAALFDAIILGFSVIEPKVNEDLGDYAERVSYANRLLTWLAGEGEPDLVYAYLPLVMGGLVVNLFVTLKDDNPWTMLYDLREAYRGRIRLVTGETAAVIKMMARLLDEAEEALKRSRIARP